MCNEAQLMCDLDNYNNHKPNEFIQNLNYQWKEAKELIKKQAIKSKTIYDGKYVEPPHVYKVGDFVRMHNKTIQQGLKFKLRNDRYGEPCEIIEVLSPQNIKIKWKGKTKVINVNNVKPKEPDRSLSEKSTTQTTTHQQKTAKTATRQPVQTKTNKPVSTQVYVTRYGRHIRPRILV
jgi:hypothetical protein